MADAMSVWSYMKVVSSAELCVDNRTCVCVGMDVGKSFPVNVELI